MRILFRPRQTCVCANRFLVQDGVYDEFAQKLKAAVESMQQGTTRTTASSCSMWHISTAQNKSTHSSAQHSTAQHKQYVAIQHAPRPGTKATRAGLAAPAASEIEWPAPASESGKQRITRGGLAVTCVCIMGKCPTDTGVPCSWQGTVWMRRIRWGRSSMRSVLFLVLVGIIRTIFFICGALLYLRVPHK